MPNPPAASVTFVLVGHCRPDSGMLTTAATRSVPGANVVRANTDEELVGRRQAGHVWLVNRELDGDFRSADGVALIEREARGADAPTLILVSNYAEAQTRAAAVGARPGFGKRHVHAETTQAILRDAAGLPA